MNSLEYVQAPRVTQGDPESHEPMVVGLLAWEQGPLAGQGLGQRVCVYADMIASLCIVLQTASTGTRMDYLHKPMVHDAQIHVCKLHLIACNPKALALESHWRLSENTHQMEGYIR